MMVLGDGAFGRSLGHESGALMGGMSILMKKTPERSLAPSAMRGHRAKMAMHQTPALS